MSSQIRVIQGRSQQMNSANADGSACSYILLRDEKNNSLRMVLQKEIISAKASAKIEIGDVVSHGVRNKRFRGSHDQCKQSMEIISRTRRPPEEDRPKATNSTVVPPVNEESAWLNNQVDRSGSEESEKNLEGDTSLLDEPEMENEGASNTEEDIVLTRKENESVNCHRSPLSDLNNKSDESPDLNAESSIVVKRKLSPNDESPDLSSSNKRVKSVGYVSAREHSKLALQLANAAQENEIYQTTWMPRPVDKATINYFIHIGKILSHELSAFTSEEDDITRNKLVHSISAKLGTDENELASCIGKTILSTARQVVSKVYPDPDTVFADVDREHVKAIAEYACLMHPTEKGLNDFSKLRKAMGNVFATRKFSRKRSSGEAFVQFECASGG